MTIEQIYIYRMTHIENIPHILKYGITHRNSPQANPQYIPIGDSSLISCRDSKQLPVDNGINDNGRTITLGDFIPFYFGVRMPMLYVIQQGGNDVPEARKPDEIVYVACRISEVVKTQDEFYFTNGHATDIITHTYDKSKYADIPSLIDWKAIESRYWGGEENLLLKVHKQAEFLASSDIPSSAIYGFLCYNEIAKNKLDSYINGSNYVIKIYPKAYY